MVQPYRDHTVRGSQGIFIKAESPGSGAQRAILRVQSFRRRHFFFLNTRSCCEASTPYDCTAITLVILLLLTNRIRMAFEAVMNMLGKFAYAGYNPVAQHMRIAPFVEAVRRGVTSAEDLARPL